MTASIDWKRLNSIGLVESVRTVNNKTSVGRRYYIASIDKDAQLFGKAVRTHWEVENSLNWVLDVSFREDECRVRKDNGAENFSILRHIALNYLKNEKTLKRAIKGKRNRAGWDAKYLEKIIEI